MAVIVTFLYILILVHFEILHSVNNFQQLLNLLFAIIRFEGQLSHRELGGTKWRF